MGIARATPDHKCKAFLLTLERSAFRWYKKLHPGRIHSWKDLKTTIRNKFVSSSPGQLFLQCLYDLRQGKNESLKIFLACFTEEMHHCKNITETEMFSALK
ncbi:uncharacterized protein Fot_02539 [Forsythia ovata]|uniref:Retrotransposon gag domain-containing protein n=1 Tax=Forsythia ovata TaxID=205694 RepID=A0ABD1X800_9LAMI